MTAADPMVVELVREVLVEELARLRAESASTGGARAREERVHIADDADLAAFARRVLIMADDREARQALEQGKVVFRLDASTGRAAGDGRSADDRDRAGAASPLRAAPTPDAAGHTEVIEHGLLSERRAGLLPRETVRVRIGQVVRMTPLARDRLRRRGIAIERTKP